MRQSHNFGIEQDMPPNKDLNHFVKWPPYTQLQQQKLIIYKRVKVPPAINQSHRCRVNNYWLAHRERPQMKQEEEAEVATLDNKKAVSKGQETAFL